MPTDHIPKWLPDEYDFDASLYDRLPIMAKIEGGIELHASNGRWTEILGSPAFLNDCAGHRVLMVGGTNSDDWDWEVAVTDDGWTKLYSANLEYPAEDYEATRREEMRDFDVRIFGIDTDLLEEKDG